MGEALCRVLEFNGYKIIRTNYQGDIGPHVAKCIWGYLNLKQKEPKDKKGIWLGKVYALASKKANSSKKVEEEIREINNKIYAKDKKYVDVLKKTRKYCPCWTCPLRWMSKTLKLEADSIGLSYWLRNCDKN